MPLKIASSMLVDGLSSIAKMLVFLIQKTLKTKKPYIPPKIGGPARLENRRKQPHLSTFMISPVSVEALAPLKTLAPSVAALQVASRLGCA